MDGFGPLGAFFGPGGLGGLGFLGLFGGFGFFFFGERELALFLLGSLRGLELGAEPADEATGFFGGPLGVQGDQALQDFLIAEGARPAVGVEDGLVEVVVDLPEDADKPLPLMLGTRSAAKSTRLQSQMKHVSQPGGAESSDTNAARENDAFTVVASVLRDAIR